MSDMDQKITEACHRIESLWYETGGKCYVSFSGGKDSTVLLALIKMCEEILTVPAGGIPAVFSNTGIEMGVTVDFVKWCRDSGWYPNIIEIRPDVSFDWVLKTYGKPMLSKVRSELLHRWQTGTRTESVMNLFVYGRNADGGPAWKQILAAEDFHMLHDDFEIRASAECCHHLKKKPFRKFEKEAGMAGALVGIREGEGGARAMQAGMREKSGGKLCTYTVGKMLYKAPIIDWTEAEVDQFIREHEVPLSKAYTVYGFDRTGCMACPYSARLTPGLRYLKDHEPNRYRAAMYWLKDVFIAQNVEIPFDREYESDRDSKWRNQYWDMRVEMLEKYRPDSRLLKKKSPWRGRVVLHR